MSVIETFSPDLIAAITAAMTEYLEHGHFQEESPAILACKGMPYYGCATSNDRVIHKLDSYLPFGEKFDPLTEDDIPHCASAFSYEITADLRDYDTRTQIDIKDIPHLNLRDTAVFPVDRCTAWRYQHRDGYPVEILYSPDSLQAIISAGGALVWIEADDEGDAFFRYQIGKFEN